MISMFEETRAKLPGLAPLAPAETDQRAAEAVGADISRPIRIPRRIEVVMIFPPYYLSTFFRGKEQQPCQREKIG